MRFNHDDGHVKGDWDHPGDLSVATRPRRPAHELIADEDYRPRHGDSHGVHVEDGPTDRQLSFVRSLLSERGIDPDAFFEKLAGEGEWSKRGVSVAIDTLRLVPKPGSLVRRNRYPSKCARCHAEVEADAGLLQGSPGAYYVVHEVCPERTEPEPQRRHSDDVPEGIHFVDGVVYKVQVAVHGSGRKYAKRLDHVGAGWQYTPEAMKLLSADTLMTLEDAQAFGQLYGVCCKCGRTLTDEVSIEAGIGPVCATRW